MKIHLKKHASGFYPADEPAERAIARTKEGDIVEATLVRPRSQGRLRFWWSLVGFLVEQLGRDEWTKKTTGEMLKILCGHCTLIVSPSGKHYPIADSISFGSGTTEDEFAEMTRKAVRVAAKVLRDYGQQNWTPEEVERCRIEFENRWG